MGVSVTSTGCVTWCDTSSLTHCHLLRLHSQTLLAANYRYITLQVLPLFSVHYVQHFTCYTYAPIGGANKVIGNARSMEGVE